jgi:hypothetical protein
MKWLCIRASKLFWLSLAFVMTITASTKAPITFTLLDSGLQDDLTSIAIGRGIYIATSSSHSLRSIDGIHWTTQAAVGNKVIFGNDRFVSSSPIRYSFDGISWSDPTIAGDPAAGNGIFVSIGTAFQSSTDLVSWTSSPFPLYYYGFTSPIFKDGIFYSVGVYRFSSAHRQAFALSTNGVDWTIRDGPNILALFDDILHPTTAANGLLYALQGSNGQYFTSSNGVNWTPYAKDPMIISGIPMKFLNDRLVTSPHNVSSQPPYGKILIEHGSGFDVFDGSSTGTTNQLKDVAFDGAEYYFVGAGGVIVKTQGASALASSLRVDPPQNGTVHLSVTGSPGTDYELQSAATSQIGSNPTPTLQFTLSTTSTNFTLPYSANAPSFFRLVER